MKTWFKWMRISLCLVLALVALLGCHGTHRVTYYDGKTALYRDTVTHNQTATAPEPPTKEGYVFDGWYSDAKWEEEYDFTKPVGQNVNLYAKWLEDTSDR